MTFDELVREGIALMKAHRPSPQTYVFTRAQYDVFKDAIRSWGIKYMVIDQDKDRRWKGGDK